MQTLKRIPSFSSFCIQSPSLHHKMVQHHRFSSNHQHQFQNYLHREETTMEEIQQHHKFPYEFYICCGKIAKGRFFFTFFFCLIFFGTFFGLLLLPRLIFDSSSFARFSLNSSIPVESTMIMGKSKEMITSKEKGNTHTSASNNSIFCDRTSFKTDVCFMKGDVRTLSPKSTIILYNSPTNKNSTDANAVNAFSIDKIRPYPRKWERGIMATVKELNLIKSWGSSEAHPCDLRHDVTAVVFYTGGYNGNLYHEFNDVIVPLYITSQHFNKQVVFVILKYRNWWVSKYKEILSQLSNYPLIDFSGDPRIHCFPEAVVGLFVHNELSINPSKTVNNKTILDFRRLLDNAYHPPHPQTTTKKPKLVIMSRNGSRGIENENDLVNLCKKIGFDVQVLRPNATTQLSFMYSALSNADAMVGVHGAALTHFLFMRPETVFIQIVPLGNDWVAETCFGKAAVKMGLKYIKYEILPEESSLHRRFGKDDPVLRDPRSVAARGWQVAKELYLEGQSVKLDLHRFGPLVTEAYQYTLKLH